MFKIDKELKNDIDQGFAIGKYIGNKVLVGFIILAIVLGIIGFVFKYVGKNSDRIIFKQTITYNEGVLDDLAKYRLEIITSNDPIEKSAIAELVNSRFANYDETKIENNDLKYFLKDCRNGKYSLEH